MGIAPVVMDKLKIAHKSAIEGLDHMRSANVKLGLGTDLLGELYDQQCREFTLRREVFQRSEEHTSELQSLMRISYAVFCLKKNTNNLTQHIMRLKITHY